MFPFIAVNNDTMEVEGFSSFEDTTDFIANTPDSDFTIYVRSIYQVTGFSKEVITKPVVEKVHPVPDFTGVPSSEAEDNEGDEGEAVIRHFKMLPAGMKEIRIETLKDLERVTTNYMGGPRFTEAEKKELRHAADELGRSVTAIVLHS